jgi:hypothetical protein
MLFIISWSSLLSSLNKSWSDAFLSPDFCLSSIFTALETGLLYWEDVFCKVVAFLAYVSVFSSF